MKFVTEKGFFMPPKDKLQKKRLHKFQKKVPNLIALKLENFLKINFLH